MLAFRCIRPLPNQRFIVCRAVSSSETTKCWHQELVISEFPASEAGLKSKKRISSSRKALVYVPDGIDAWKKREHVGASDVSSTSLQDYLFVNVISHFLPAQYPHSVQSGYAKFTSFCFAASVAGSAGMVLSTQTLLLAVGVVGSQQVQTAGIMAGALNWVLKDGVGQLGGVWFASRMGHTKRFDTHPKKWRMTAALALDAAALMEILSPFAASWLVLPVACTANVLKNIGFLTASASRAALHQSLALSNNLADVTVKAGTQSMAAGLVGTAVGVGLSTTVLGHDPLNFVLGFCCLSAGHIGCNYMAMQSVAINHLNRQRLDLLLEEYFEKKQIMTPLEVAGREQYFPLLRERDSSDWLCIGGSLLSLAPHGIEQLQKIMEAAPNAKYILSADEDKSKIRLVFLEQASGEDLIRGVFHARLMREELQKDDQMIVTCIGKSYAQMEDLVVTFNDQLLEAGWQTKLTNIEPAGSLRLAIDEQ